VVKKLPGPNAIALLIGEGGTPAEATPKKSMKSGRTEIPHERVKTKRKVLNVQRLHRKKKGMVNRIWEGHRIRLKRSVGRNKGLMRQG